MSIEFKANPFDNKGSCPLLKEVKIGDLIEAVLSHPHDGNFRYGGYVTGIDYSNLFLSPVHPSNPEEGKSIGPLNVRMITEYRMHDS